MYTGDVKIKRESGTEYESVSVYGMIAADYDFPIAQPKINMVSVLGADSALDVSGVMDGRTEYNQVTGTITLIVISEGTKAVTDFIAEYHGETICVISGDDTGKYRVGRCYISSDDRRKRMRRIVLTIIAEPYRLSTTESVKELTVGTDYELSSDRLSTTSYWSEFTQGTDGYKMRTYALSDGRIRYESFILTMDDDGDFTVSWNDYCDSNATCYVDIYKQENGNWVKSYKKESSDTVKLEGSTEGNMYKITLVGSGTQGAYYGIKNFVVVGEAENTVTNHGQKILIPSYTSSINCKIKCRGYEAKLVNGGSGKLWEFPLCSNDNQIIVIPDSASQTGTVRLTYREGWL